MPLMSCSAKVYRRCHVAYPVKEYTKIYKKNYTADTLRVIFSKSIPQMPSAGFCINYNREMMQCALLYNFIKRTSIKFQRFKFR